MNSTEPLVSVCCITYNHADYIRSAIEGFLMQKTTFSVEIIIHDDASTDGTADIIKSYAAKYPNLIFPIYQTENQFSKGIKISMTYVWPKAKGKYIALCEGDDYWIDPYKLEKQVEFLESNTNFYLASGKTIIRKGNMLYQRNKSWNKWNKFKTEYSVKDYIINPFFFHTSTICCRNYNRWDNIPAYEIFAGDLYFPLFQSIPGRDNIKFFDEYFSVYRDHPGGITKSNPLRDINRSGKSFISILEDFNRFRNGKYAKYTNYKIKERKVLIKIFQADSRKSKVKIALENIRISLILLVRKFTGIYAVNDSTLKFLS